MKIKSFLFISILLFGFWSCNKTDSNDVDLDPYKKVHITVFYTNDEHGWIEASESYGGAAGLMNKWKDEGYDESDNYLILSGGDMWSGPAISTWFQGKSTAETMRGMDYDAAAIGNHEFDFKVEVLNERLNEQAFPLLSANIVDNSTGKLPDFAQAYIIKEIEGVKVGIIGLSSLSTPYTTFPTHVENYSFTAYRDALDQYVPLAKQDGSEILILIGHICSGEIEALLPYAKIHGISIIGGGHCHQRFAYEDQGVYCIQSGSNMQAYAKVEFDYAVASKELTNVSYGIVQNTPGEPDETILSIVNYWSDQAMNELSDIIGYTDETIYKSSSAMGNMVCDSWLYTFPHADVSLTNSGGIRQNIERGNITMSTIVGLLPFENTILELDLTGKELFDVSTEFLKGGMQTVNGITLSDGTPIHEDSVYTVLTTDYLYSVTSTKFAEYDDNPVQTYIHYRQPLIDWLKSINTSQADPLRNYLDHTSR